MTIGRDLTRGWLIRAYVLVGSTIWGMVFNRSSRPFG
jgi:hypothetical protein